MERHEVAKVHQDLVARVRETREAALYRAQAPTAHEVVREMLAWERRCLAEIVALDRLRVAARTKADAERYGPRRADVLRLLAAVEAMRRTYDRCMIP